MPIAQVKRPILGHVAIPNQRRTAECREIDVQLDVLHDTKRARHISGGRDLPVVSLPVANRQRKQIVAVRPFDGAGSVGIETAAQQQNRASHPWHSRHPWHPWHLSDPSDVRSPDVLVSLKLKTN